MFDQLVHGGSVDRPFGRRPLRAILTRVGPVCVLLLSMLWFSNALAGALYRCTGAQGEAVFSSSVAGFRGCRRISTFAAPSAPPASTVARSGLAGVTGTAVTTAPVLSAGSDATASLTGVRGTVETSARRLGEPSPRVSLAAVAGSVQGSAGLPRSPEHAGEPGQWSYRESHGPLPSLAEANDPASRVLRGAVYRIVRPDGSVEYTNLPPAGRKGHVVTMLFSYIATCAACNLHSPIHWGSVELNLTAYADTIRAASIEYGVDEAFLRAIIHAESAFNPRALSLKGAQGLMQLMPSTAGDMGVLDAFNSEQNIRGGARYLGLLLRDFRGDERLAAAAYNAGPAAVQRYHGVPPYAETQVYVERVGALRKRYGAVIRQPLAAAR